MRKQVKRYFRSSLCGMLSAAMIAASLIVPDMTVYAAPQDEVTTQNEEDKLVEGTTVEGEDADAEDKKEDGNSGSSSEGEEGSGEESGDGFEEEGDEKLDGEDEKDPDGDLTDDEEEEKDGIDDDLKSDEEEKEGDELLSIRPMAVEDSGKLLQGDFEGSWDDVNVAWQMKPAFSGGNFELKENSFDSEKFGKKSLYIWKDKNTNTYIEVKQTVNNADSGVYQVSLDIGGAYSQDALTLTVETGGESVTKSLGKGDGWNKWNEGIKTEAFEATAGNDITLTIAGTISQGDAEEQVHIDNVKLNKLSYTLAELSTLLTEANKLNAGDYTEESWSKFAEAKGEANKLVEGNSTDAIKITLAYAQLKEAKDALVSAGMTLYYYVGELTPEGKKPIQEVGLCYWCTDNTNISTKANEVSGWYGWGNSNNKTYQMSPTGYKGWYSIPIQFANNGADAGFSIHVFDGENTECIMQHGGSNNETTNYEKLAKSTQPVCAVKGNVFYEGSDKAAAIIRQVTLYIYGIDTTGNDFVPYIQSDNAISKVDEATGTPSTLTPTNSKFYSMTQEGNWYYLTFSAPGNIVFDSNKICNYYTDGFANANWKADLLNGPIPSSVDWNAIDFTPVFAGNNFYYKGQFYASKEDAEATDKITLAMLQERIAQAKKLKEEDYKEEGWSAFQTAISDAEAVVANEERTDTEIEDAYNDLGEKMDALVPNVKADVKVDRVALSDDFITGADLSSYISLKESGVVFKDEKGNPLSDAGFFKYLYEGGTNWVRIRVWNDPYNSSGKGYGGGNNDLEKAKTIGKLATNAGMRVLIDFHYSDFWADPGKQDAPKAWKAYTVGQKETAVYDYTLSSLNALRAAGVDVGMVQVGNETNNGICGEKSTANMIKIFNAGSRAVKEFDESCLVAIHFTNPEKGNYAAVADKFADVNYDVFATSYYPFWHGTTANLTAQLGYVAAKGKKVMVAETSWVTTWDDGDGHENTAPRETGQTLTYDISLQGQADEVRAVVAAAAAVGPNSIGVFYWEPAWISPYYVYDEDGKRIDSLYKQNQELWEKYGSGWASSYAGEYDPGDAGKWYGGSAIDNQSWFDFDGTAFATAKIYSLIRTGAEADRAITSVETKLTKDVVVGSGFTYPQVTAKYNDGTTEQLDVTWDVDEQKLVNLYKMGEYVVHGTVNEGGKEYKVTLTIKVIRKAENNMLVNPGFEDSGNDLTKPKGWDIDPASGSAVSTKASDWQSNPRTDDYAMNFWFASKGTFTVSQTVTPEAGTYSFGGYIQGDAADVDDVQYIFADVYGGDGTLKSRKKASFTLNGWRNWSEPEITGIIVSDGDTVKVGAEILTTEDGAWGSLDDFYLYGTHSVTVEQNEGGTAATTVLKANSGEKVGITVTPESGYYIETLTISGASITADKLSGIFTSENGTVAFRAATGDAKSAAVLTYDAEMADAMSESFTMPNGNVTVSATFVSVFDEAAEKISLDAKGEDGKYLVLVNGKDDETPIEDQYYTGKVIKPAVELSYMGYKLTSADYTVSYAKNKTVASTITLTARGDRFEGERTISFGIKEDIRNEFKNLKVIFVNPDKGDGSTPDKSIYYLGKQKELEPEIALIDRAGNPIVNPRENPIYEVYYHNNKKIGKATVVVLPTDEGLGTYKEGSVTTTFKIEKCPLNYEKVKVSITQPNQFYTGKKVEPAVTVKLEYYDSKEDKTKTAILTKGTDYAVTYTNNVNATTYYENKVDLNGDPIPRSLASISITGIGNFAGRRVTDDEDKKLTFAINPRSIENATITAADLAEGRGAAPKLTVKDGTKTIAANQYVITKITNTDKNEDVYTYDQQTNAKTGRLNLRDAGNYTVTVAGKKNSNYTDEKTAAFKVTGKEYLISNANIKIKGKFIYTGNPITLTPSEVNAAPLEVVAGSGRNAKTLEAGTDYTVAYENNTNAGRATITITGMGEYVGKKTATFTIGRRKLVYASAIETDKDKLYKGILMTPVLSEKKIKTQLDGIWISDNENGNLKNEDNDGEKGTLLIPYTGYTLNPEFTFSVTNGGVTEDEEDFHPLTSNEYMVSYSVGKWVETQDENGEIVKTAPVTATVRGVGNYSGSVRIPNLFMIKARDLRDLSIEVEQIAHNGGRVLKPSVTFSKIEDGRVVDLKLGTAYTVTYKNNKFATLLGMADNKKPRVTVKVKGNGWIIDKSDKDSREWEDSFTIDQEEIVEANVADIAIQTYKGKALTPAVTIKVNGKKLKAGTDYTVTYSDNIKRSGTSIGKVTIVGKGNYFTRNPIVKEFVIK